MVTVIAGKANQSSVCKIISFCDTVGTRNCVEFDISNRSALKAGEPTWANYVKGCVAKFLCMSSYF